MKKAWAIWVAVICFTACFDLSQEVKEALELAGKNRWELKRVLFRHQRV